MQASEEIVVGVRVEVDDSLRHGHGDRVGAARVPLGADASLISESTDSHY